MICKRLSRECGNVAKAGGNGASLRSAGKGVNGAPAKNGATNGVAYRLVTSRVLTDSKDDLQEDI